MIVYRVVDRCISCGACLDECERDAIRKGDVYRIDQALCGGCGLCAEVCPVDAVKPLMIEESRPAAAANASLT